MMSQSSVTVVVVPPAGDCPTGVTVIIPARNERTTIGGALDALADQRVDRPWEVIVVDNGSTDGTAEEAMAWSARLPALRVLHEPTPGRHHACDSGAAAATYENLLFLDADDEAAPGYVEAMADALDEAAMACGFLDHNALNPPDVAAIAAGFQPAELIPQFCFLPFAAGCAMGIHRSTYVEAGGYGDLSFAEDVDLSWRVQLAGYAIRPVPDAILRYRQRGDARGMFRQHRNYARARPALFKRYRQFGMPRRPAPVVVGDWVTIARGAVVRKTPEERIRWTRRAARAIGFVEGSIRHRVLYL